MLFSKRHFENIIRIKIDEYVTGRVYNTKFLRADGW